MVEVVVLPRNAALPTFRCESDPRGVITPIDVMERMALVHRRRRAQTIEDHEIAVAQDHRSDGRGRGQLAEPLAARALARPLWIFFISL